MNITVKIVDLLQEMVLLEKVVSKKANPILQNVLIRAEDNTLTLTASDIEIELTCRCPAVIETNGSVTLPARRLLDLLRVQSAPTVTLTAKQDVTHFASGAFKSRLQTLAPSDFPLLPEISGEAMVLPRVPLLRALEQVRFVVEDKTQAQYFMQGVKLDIQDQMVTAVAVSTQRVALTSFSVAGLMNHEVLLPIKLIDELMALLAEDDGQIVQFHHTEQHLSFIVGHRHLKSGQIDGKFPAYRRVIPADPTTMLTVPRLELAAVIRRHLLIDTVIHLAVGDAIDISSKSAEVGESAESIKVDRRGPDTEITLRGDHLLDCLNAAVSQTVSMEMKTKSHPLMVVDGAYVTVIMGMTV